jgi:hypothetical protein
MPAMSALGLPFAHLNLRRNPFGEPPVDTRASLAIVDLPDLRAGEPVQLIGDSGRGKTTHLLALRARHPGAFYERLHEGESRLREPAPAAGTFLLDEAQRLNATDLRRLTAGDLVLAFGTHHDLSPVVGRPLRTVRVDVVDVARLRAIVDRRLEWARRAPGPVPVVPDAVLSVLIARHGTDVRAIEGALYDAVQKLEEPGHVEV